MAKSVVYILSPEDGLYKIGRTTDLDKRIKELSTGSAAKFKVVDTFEGDAATEKVIKDAFEEHRDRSAGGSEFYRFGTDEIVRSKVSVLVQEAKETKAASSELAAVVKEAEAADDWDDLKVLPVDKDTVSDVQEFRRLKAQQRFIDFKLNRIGSRIKTKLARGRAGKARVAVGDEISWCVSRSHPIDTAKLKRDYPEIAEKVTTVRETRTFRV